MNDLDQFYTKIDVAKQCLDVLEQNVVMDNCFILEPSAGTGAFLKYLKYDYYACDIEPKGENIECKDFLKDDIFDKLPKDKHIIVLGNPPFGKRSKLALEFIEKAFTYSDTIGFILPVQFLKYLTQKQIRNDARLIYSEILEPESFIHDDKSYSVRCCFQIWTINDDKPDLRLRIAPKISHEDFEMWQYNNTKQALKYFDKDVYGWDFAVPRQGYQDYTIRETNPDKMDRRKQWIFFKAKNQEVLMKLISLDFDKLSKKNTSTPGFGKADVIEEYEKSA